MTAIFGVFKSFLLMMGISHCNEQSVAESLAKQIVVFLIMGSWTIYLFTGAIASGNLTEIIESFILGMNCSVPLVIYTYILYYKSKLFSLIDDIESSLNESKMI